MIAGTILFLMLYIFFLIGIYFAIKKMKEALGHGIQFKEAVVRGLTVSITTALFSVIFAIVFYELLYPTYVADTIEGLIFKMESAGVPANKLNAKLGEKEAYFGTWSQSLYSFVGNLITGVAFTLLLSFFLKSNTKK